MTDSRRLREIQRQLESLAAHEHHPTDRLANLVADLVDCLVEPEEASAIDLAVGQEVVVGLRVRATVIERSDGRGLCFKLLLESRDFVEPREIAVDADEIVAVAPR